MSILYYDVYKCSEIIRSQKLVIQYFILAIGISEIFDRLIFSDIAQH